MVFNTEITHAVFDGKQWSVTTSKGEVKRFNFVISATGILHRPNIPIFKNQQLFSRHIFHSSRFNHDVDLAGKKVGIIGAGSTAVQMTAPIAKLAQNLTLFQRDPQWIVPMKDKVYSPRQNGADDLFPAGRTCSIA